MKRTTAVAACLLLTSSCLYVYRLEVNDATRSYPVSEITGLDAGTRNGGIEVTVSTDTVITIDVTRVCYGRDREDAEAHIDEIVITDEVSNGRLHFNADMPAGRRNFGAAFDIRCPSDIDLGLATSNGDVRLSGMAARAVISTSNGEVTVQTHRGPLDIRTSNGNVGADVAAIEHTDDIDVETSNGDVDLFLPDDISATLEISTSNGDITIHGFEVTYQEQAKDRVRATIGSGSVGVTVKTSNGSVAIREH